MFFWEEGEDVHILDLTATPPALRPQDCTIDITCQMFHNEHQVYYVEGILSSVMAKRYCEC